MPKEKYKIVISKDALGDIKSTKSIFLIHSNIVNMLKFNLLCRGRFHHYGNPCIKRPHVLAVNYKENAENQQIKLLLSLVNHIRVPKN